MNVMGVFFLAVGVWFIVFHRSSGQLARKWYGYLLTAQGECLIRVECVVCGLLLFTLGLLDLLGVLHRGPGA